MSDQPSTDYLRGVATVLENGTLADHYRKAVAGRLRAACDELDRLRDENKRLEDSLSRRMGLISRVYRITGQIPGGNEEESAKRLRDERDRLRAENERLHLEHRVQHDGVDAARRGEPIENCPYGPDKADGFRDSALMGIWQRGHDLARLRAENAEHVSALLRLRESAASDPEVLRAVVGRINAHEKLKVRMPVVNKRGRLVDFVTANPSDVLAALCPPPEPERRTGKFTVVAPGGTVGEGYQHANGFAVWWADNRQTYRMDTYAPEFYGAAHVTWEAPAQ